MNINIYAIITITNWVIILQNGNLSNRGHANFSFYIDDMFSAKCIWVQYLP